MINIAATIRWKGYCPNDLKPKSNKRIWAICDKCGTGRWVRYQSYNKKYEYLCKSCSMKGRILSENHKQKISDSGKGRKAWNNGLKHSEESRRKMSINQTGKKHSEKTRRKMSISMKGKNKGKIHSDESRKNMRDGQKDRKPVSEETLNKMSAAHKGITHSIESRKKMSVVQTGKKRSKEIRIQMSVRQQNISYDEWEGFITKQPYCPAFNETCKESNRAKYNRECFICGLSENENNTKAGTLKKLSVHHIDMDRGQGCDGKRWKLVPLCLHCHGKVHSNLWQNRITYLLNVSSK